MRDVSALAGVSVSTVSHVLNHTRPVSDTATRSVADAIRATGYTHNTLARSLRVAESKTIGLVMGGIANPFFTGVIHFLEVAVRRAGYTLLLGDSDDDADREMDALQTLLGRQVDGIVLAASPAGGQEAIRFLQERHVPAVQIDRVAVRSCDYVVARNEVPTCQLVVHLAELGHQHIAMVTGAPGLSTTRERLAGFRRGLAESGLPLDDGLLVSGHSRTEPARLAVHSLFALADPPSALVIGNNLMTLGAMRALREMALGVPDDVAIVSFDDFDWADLFSPRLTTVAQPYQDLAEQAVSILLGRISEPGRPHRRVTLATKLCHRDSCGCTTPSDLNIRRQPPRRIYATERTS